MKKHSVILRREVVWGERDPAVVNTLQELFWTNLKKNKSTVNNSNWPSPPAPAK